ncbi:uncharacterized protein [Diadema antillarum]|uniref:uncharacterized protein n=1 Tax=Diadema antillarum TaxID=105358 RepID=UPI003A85BA34
MGISTWGRKVDISWLDISPKRHKPREPRTKRDRPGRIALHKEFPAVIEASASFIESNGFKAHRRRQNEIGTCGTSVPQLRNHLLATIPGLKEAHPKLCRRTIARMMQPPNKGTRSAASYKGLIQARVPRKDNSARKPNDNSHFCSTRVRYTLEMAAKLGQRALLYSADNKNKVRVGDETLAVDRRIEINRLFPTTDCPVYNDHDFPNPGYLITPAGYLELEPHQVPVTTKDHLGRDRFKMPEKSRATVILRSPHSANNVASHMSDMARHLRVADQVASGKRALVLLVDGGPDFNPNHAVNQFFYSRFFHHMNLDAMVVTSYASGDSALNPVEHVWAPCTRALTGVYLPATLPGETCPPHRQRLSAEEKLAKENAVFDAAMSRIKDSYWRNVQFTGKDITVVVEPSGAPPQPYGEDFATVKEVINGSGRRLRQSDLSHEYSFMAQHMDKRIGMVIFTKCDERNCEHCRNNPPLLSSDDMQLLRNFPTPKPSEDFPGHFATFLEVIATPNSAAPCEHMPQFQMKGLGRCQRDGCRYVFTSQKDMGDHRQKVHRE